jgi:glycosyltransferase involved in cell wall biosynthesis
VKKICINGKFFSQRITGTQRYARELLNQLDRLLSAEDNREIAIEILVPKQIHSVPRYTSLQVRTVGRMGGTRWEQLELPQYCRGQLLFTLSGGAPVLHSRNVVTIHDAAVIAAPTGYSLAYRLWHGNMCRRMARTAEHIFTNSNFSKSEIVKWYGGTAEKITVTYLGSEHFSRLEADASALTRFGLSGKYVLAASSHNPNKNFQRVAQAICQLDTGTQIVIAGAQDRRVYRGSVTLPDGVHVLGYVTDPELKALYQNAACFVFASLYEGFGLPPLEAMASGCPVVVSNTASLPELFDGAAFFCDPYNPEDIAGAVQRAVKSPPAAAYESMAFASKFSWEKCARETLGVISAL